MTHTYYFLENGEVIFIEIFPDALEALAFRAEQFPKSTLTVKVKGQD